MIPIQAQRNYFTWSFPVDIKKWNEFQAAMEKEEKKSDIRLIQRDYDSTNDYFIAEIGVPFYGDSQKRAERIYKKFTNDSSLRKS